MFDPDAMDEVLRLLPGPVAIVGAARQGELGGLTAAWLTRVSQTPPLLLVAIGHERHTWQLLRDAREFTISIPGVDQVPVARLFGLQSRRDVDKWAQVEHVLLGEGTPALARGCARFLCALSDRFTTGDHDCLVGRVVAAESLGQAPLPLRGADYVPEA